MAQCNNCLHFEVCEKKDKKINIGNRVRDLIHDCICFKDKLEYVKQNHGYWIAHDLLFEPSKCSVCGRTMYNTNGADYCPHCGAKMDLEE